MRQNRKEIREKVHGKSESSRIKVLCQLCKNLTTHEILKSVTEKGSSYLHKHPEESYQWENEYEIIECLGCSTISFRSLDSNSVDYDIYGPEGKENLYPERTIDSHPKKVFINVPDNLLRIYIETIECLNRGYLTLCGAGVRILVEGFCRENNILKGNVEVNEKGGGTKMVAKETLEGKINGLYEENILTEEHARILHEIRFLGNDAVHELSSHSKEVLVTAIEIVENILYVQYEVPYKGSYLTNRRKRLK